MRLLVVTQYFWPEAFIINELVKTLREQGHCVVVATGKPNYPEGRVFDGYRAAGTQKERFDSDIDIIRVPLRPRGDGGSWNLILNYGSFVWSGLRWFPSLLAGYDVDAIVVYAPSPITAAVPAILLKWVKKAHLAIWIQDLWPETLVATGHIRSRAVLAAVGLLVRAIYRCADTLLVQSRAFVAPVSRYARLDKVAYYPNSIRVSAFDENTDGQLPAELIEALTNHFCLVFAGNIGSVQAIPTLVDAAKQLQELRDVKVVLIGSGSMSAWVAQRKLDLGLDNLILVDRLPTTAMPAVYHRARGLLVTLKDDEVLSHTIPSKLQAYLAAGLPIIAALPGEGARVVDEAAAGLTCAPEDPAALANSIRSLHAMSEAERTRMGAAGKRYFAAHFDMSSQAGRLVQILAERIGEKGGRP
jgi:glycosyltransferase involved in cell wall biosynthesis